MIQQKRTGGQQNAIIPINAENFGKETMKTNFFLSYLNNKRNQNSISLKNYYNDESTTHATHYVFVKPKRKWFHYQRQSVCLDVDSGCNLFSFDSSCWGLFLQNLSCQ